MPGTKRTVKPQPLGPAPPFGSTVAALRDYIARGYGLPDGYVVERVVRFGGLAGSALHVHIKPPGRGDHLVIRYEREVDCTNAGKLRAQAAADTNGLSRGDLLNPKGAAQSMYEALCALADTFDAIDERDTTLEWVQRLNAVASEVAAYTLSSLDPGSRYRALKELRDYPYSKQLVVNPALGQDNKPLRHAPPVLVDRNTGERYVTAWHFAVFLRHDVDVGPIADAGIASRLKAIGGDRLTVEQWPEDRGGEDKKVRLVLYRLPQTDSDAAL